VMVGLIVCIAPSVCTSSPASRAAPHFRVLLVESTGSSLPFIGSTSPSIRSRSFYATGFATLLCCQILTTLTSFGQCCAIRSSLLLDPLCPPATGARSEMSSSSYTHRIPSPCYRTMSSCHRIALFCDFLCTRLSSALGSLCSRAANQVQIKPSSLAQPRFVLL
jgi:hypothetical protein